MDLFGETIHDFGRHLGLASLSPGSTGCVDLSIEKIGRLQVEKDGETVHVTLARPRAPHSENAARTALELCHWRENHPWTIRAGMKGDDLLLFIASLPLVQTDVPTLDRILFHLSALHDKVEKAG